MRQLHSLGNHYLDRDVLLPEFVQAQSQDIALDRPDAVKTPVLGRLGDLTVEALHSRGNFGDEPLGVLYGAATTRVGFQERSTGALERGAALYLPGVQ